VSFNKWFPDQAADDRAAALALRRAWALRFAWYASLLMLVMGYVLMVVFWNR
jgi:hypothetical protein